MMNTKKKAKFDSSLFNRNMTKVETNEDIIDYHN